MFALIIALVALTGCASLHTTALKARDIAGLPSLQEVLPGAYAGDWGDARRIDVLRENGIYYVLNVASEIEDPIYPETVCTPHVYIEGITGAKLGLVDWDDPNNETQVQEAMTTLDKWEYEWGFRHLTTCILPDGSMPACVLPPFKVLVHCQGGRNRTLYVLSRWWARRTGRNWQDVAGEIKKVRPEMALHDWMIKQGPKQ